MTLLLPSTLVRTTRFLPHSNSIKRLTLRDDLIAWLDENDITYHFRHERSVLKIFKGISSEHLLRIKSPHTFAFWQGNSIQNKLECHDGFIDFDDQHDEVMFKLRWL